MKDVTVINAIDWHSQIELEKQMYTQTLSYCRERRAQTMRSNSDRGSGESKAPNAFICLFFLT